jgi:hypothetical protein
MFNGKGFETRRLSAVGQGESTCTGAPAKHADVHVVEPGFSTPRAIMHRWLARTATITPAAP